MKFNGLESCIMSAYSYKDESNTSKGPKSRYNKYDSNCSSNNVTNSFSSHSNLTIKMDDDQCEHLAQCSYKQTQPSSDVKIMKTIFSKLLLGEDTTGGSKGHSSALSLSNSITKLAASVFGELWKLEPLPDEKKNRWRREMEWLLSPTNYMVELVPAKQYDANGRALEIMRPKAREDVHINLPALRKLDSLLLETLEAMTYKGFWYEDDSQVEEKIITVKEGKGRWFPTPRLSVGGLSGEERKNLLNQAKLVHQIFKAAKLINETILLEMPIPNIIGEALPKDGKESMGDDLYRILNTTCSSTIGMVDLLNIKSEHSALDAINRIEASIYAWKERSLIQEPTSKSPSKTSWSLKDPYMEYGKIKILLKRAELLLQQIRNKYPNLPQTFIDIMKIQYGMDIGYAVLEAYSRVLQKLAFNILDRIGDIFQADVTIDPNSPMARYSLLAINIYEILGIYTSGSSSRHMHFDKMNNMERKLTLLKVEKASYTTCLSDEKFPDSVITKPSQCCIGQDVCCTTLKMSP